MSGVLRDTFARALEGKYPQQVWGGTSGWMSAPVFGVVLRLLRERVTLIFGEDCIVVVVFDAAGPHANKDILELAYTLDMLVLLIPGQLTWLLQMLDVKVFGRLKARLRHDFMRARIESACGRLEPHAWVDIGVAAVQDLLVTARWPRAFDSVRIPSADVPATSYARLQKIAPAEDALPQMPFSPSQLDCILGRHRVELVAVLFDQPVRLMPVEHQLALRDRLRREREAVLALEAPAGELVGPSRPPLLALPAPPTPAAGSIAGRVARRRRSGLPIDLDPE